MASENKPKSKLEEVKSLLETAQVRDHFISLAFVELLRDDIAAKRWQHGVVASHAIRYADNVMRERDNKSKPAVVAIGKPEPEAVELSDGEPHNGPEAEGAEGAEGGPLKPESPVPPPAPGAPTPAGAVPPPPPPPNVPARIPTIADHIPPNAKPLDEVR